VCYVCYVSCGGLITAASCVLYNSNWFGYHEVDWICVLRVLCVLCYVCYVCYVSCGGLITAASCVLYNSNWFGYHEVDWICVLRVLCV